MRPIAPALGLAVLLAGCGAGHVLGRSETLALHHGDGLFVIAVLTNTELHLTFCKNADLTNCMDVGPLSSTSPLEVAQVSAGQYCLTRMEVSIGGGGDSAGSAGLGLVHDFPPERADCFDVAAGAITYPGHFALQNTDTSTLEARLQRGWVDHQADVRTAIDAAYPNLRRVPVHAVSVGRVR